MVKAAKTLLGKNSALTLGTALATALAAITTSIIASKLAGVLNSILLAGVISVVSAIISEIYKNMVAETTEKAKDILVEHRTLQAVSGSGETEAVEEAAVLVEDPPAEESPPQEEGPPSEETARADHRPLWKRILRYLQHNRFMQMVLLFSAVVIMTSLVHLWLFPDSAQSYYYNKTTVEKQVTEEVADPETPGENVSPSPTTTTPPEEELVGESTDEPATPETHQQLEGTDMQNLVAELENLRSANEDLQRRLSEQEALNAQIMDRLSVLESQQTGPSPTG